MCAAEASGCPLKTEIVALQGLQEGGNGRKLQWKCPALVSPVTPANLFCCYLLITVLLVAVVALSVAFAVGKERKVIVRPIFANCPRDWIGFGSKCFYFSADTRNWTHSHTSCLSLGAQLAQFENKEELNFLRRYKGSSDHWIGLHRDSSQHAWKWTDNTEYNNSVVSIRGAGEHAYMNDNGISSASVYADRKWICSKPNSHNLSCPILSTSI